MDKHYEYLTKLYLRLNGFWVTNLIIHSENPGDSSSEIDIVGIRFPYHIQDDRQVNTHNDLECAKDRIEILIADVKNYQKLDKLKFNKGLRKNKESINKLLNWLGCFPIINNELITEFEGYLNIHRKHGLNGFLRCKKDLDIGNYEFKFTFFCPSLKKWEGSGFKYINGNQMLDFVWECLNNNVAINTCSRNYDYGGWNELEKYVRFFKGSEEKVTLENFENNFK